VQGGALPALDDLAATLDGEPVAQVVRQHHAERPQQRVFEVIGETDQAAARGHAVVDIAEQDELIGGTALVGENQFARPGR
jgi:hypothetical protein